MTDWKKGVPLSSAIIVRHTPDDRSDSSKKNSGAIAMAFSRDANEYIGRYGRYSNRGDIERAMSRQDIDLSKDYGRRAAEGHTLDYIARVGSFAGKGADLQIDASLWNQYGPVDIGAVTRQMADDGGAFMDSIVTVKREHAEALGLTTKEDMQRLIRSTWTDSVMQWGLIRHASDVRWVAAYHTDANRSLHVHIHTWSARGEISPGDTLAPEATRRAKAVIYSDGYAEIRQERDRRATFLRDLSVLEARRQLGNDIEPEKERRINQRAEKGDWSERLSKQTDIVDPELKQKLELLKAKLSRELEQGKGRLSDNYRAQATARDVLTTLEKASPSYAKLCTEYTEYAQAKAELKGYGSDSYDRRAFVRAEEQDRVRRVANAVIRERQPHREGVATLRRDLVELDARGRAGHGNVTFSEKLVMSRFEEAISVRFPGGRNGVAIPASDTASINRDRGTLALINLEANYDVVDAIGDKIGNIKGAELVVKLGDADMTRVERYNPPAEDSLEKERVEEERRRQARESAEKRRYEDERRLQAAQAALNPSLLSAQSEFAVKHQMSLSDASIIGRDAARLTDRLRGTGVMSYDQLSRRDRATVDRLAENVNVKSGRIDATLRLAAERTAARTGMPREVCYERLRDVAIRSTRDRIVERAEAAGFRNSSPSERAKEGPSQDAPLMGGAYAVAELAEALVEGIAMTEGGTRRARTHTRPHVPEPEITPERGRL